jgi:L,D-transpeptidase ErfK/SrfK
MKRACALLGLILSGFVQAEPAVDGSAFSHAVIGGIFPYVAQAGDRLSLLGSRFGVSSSILARENHLDRKTPLQAGDEIWIDNLHIVPEWREDGIVINLPQRMLFFFRQGELAAAFPVGLGRPDWPTPAGDFKVVDMQTDKAWVVPPSIQEEMREEGKAVITRVAPGPKNPLGRHWIGLSAYGYGIHGTISPASVYGFLSHGCIRALPDDIETLSKSAQVGTEVVSSYRTTLLAETRDGRVFLEVHPDIYKRGIDPLEEIQSLAQSNRLSGRINWQRAFEVAQRQDGLATDVTLVR